MKRYEILNVTEIDIINGYEVGQIVDGEVRTVQFTFPNLRVGEALDVKDKEGVICIEQVREI